MNEQEFLDALRIRLAGLPQEDIEASLEFYAEAIDDRMEGGLTEQEAVAQLSSVEEISDQILSEIPLPKLLKARVTPRKSHSVWSTVLIILGAPVWLPLLLAAAICILAGYIVIWSLVLSLYAVALALAASAAAGAAGMVQSLLLGNLPRAGMALGLGMVCAGLALLLFPGLGTITKLGLRLSRNILLRVKSRLIRKENEK